MHALIGQKPIFYQSIKNRKSLYFIFFTTLPLYHNANKEG